MPAITEMTEQRPIPASANGIVGDTLTGLIGIETGKILSPGTGETGIVLGPKLAKTVYIVVSSAIDAINVIIRRFAFGQGFVFFVQEIERGCFFQVVQYDQIFCHSLTRTISNSSQHIVLHQAVFKGKMGTFYFLMNLCSQVSPIAGVVVQLHRIAITVYLYVCPARLLKTIGPGMRSYIDHGIRIGRHIIGTIHVISIQRFFPGSNKPLVIDRPHPVY